jgi:phenylpropionate dioxygenase-like ring-hydroxylating dioxygenase large terminal subunit
MKHATQIRLIREALAAIERGSPTLAETFTKNRVAVYTDPRRAAKEREILFGGYPIVVAFSSELRAPGDYVADELSPVPTLVVRNERGELRAFANMCRHRGSRLVQGAGHDATRFTCPYHAWSYDTDGRLRAIPDEYGFSGLDRDGCALMRFPVAEKYGMVWVMPKPGAQLGFEIDDYLGGLGEDLNSYGTETFELHERRVLRKPMNWKLVSDTFWEAYHIKVLHRTTIAPLFVRNLALFEPFGRNHRLVGVRTSIEKLRAMPEAEWDLLPHATILVNLFPNTILVMQSDHLEVYRIFPVPGRTDESITEVNVLIPGKDAPLAAERQWSRVMELLVGVIEQDFAVGEKIQRNFESAMLDEVVYGRFESALEHFHRSIRDALGESIEG